MPSACARQVLDAPIVQAAFEAFPEAELAGYRLDEQRGMTERMMQNLEDLMKMAQEAQTKLMQAQEDLDKVEVEGVSGGGLVKIRASAKGRIIAVDIDESLLAAVREADARGPGRRRDQRRPRQGRRRRPGIDEGRHRRPAAAAGLQDAVLTPFPSPRTEGRGPSSRHGITKNGGCRHQVRHDELTVDAAVQPVAADRCPSASGSDCRSAA